jgi:hypothetical protein
MLVERTMMLPILIIESIILLVLTVLVVSLLRAYADVLAGLSKARSDIESLQTRSAGRTMNPLVAQPREESEGSQAADVAGMTVDGEAVKIAMTGREGRVLLAFLSSGCLTCKPFWEALGLSENRAAVGGQAIIVTKDASEESPSEIRRLAPDGARTILSSSSWREFGIPGSPYFVYVDRRNGEIVGEGSAVSWEQVLSLWAQSEADNREDMNRRAAVQRAMGDDDAALASAGINPDDPSLWTARPASGSL